LIPTNDSDFVQMAVNFAKTIANDRARFNITQDDSDELTRAVEHFRTTFNASRQNGSRSQIATRQKNEAAAEVKRIITRLVQMLRVNDALNSVDCIHLGIPERSTKAIRKSCPMEPPELIFVRAMHQSSGSGPMHELRYRAISGYGKTKPDGAVRLELFVDLIPPDQEVPTRPGGNHGGRPWYLRSYTRSPIMLHPPMARVPMRVVYWARWADSTGNFGPFSATAAAWVEGGHVSSPGQIFGTNRPPQTRLHVEANATDSNKLDATYTVALLEAHYQSFTVQQVLPENPKLEVTVVKETKQIEGPVEARSESEAA
jgi:hypothetical protein